MQIDDTWVMVRWMDTPTTECIRDDGVRDLNAFDLALTGYVFIAPSIEVAKQQIIDRIVHDDLLLEYGENDEEIKPDRTKFGWDDEHAESAKQYALEYDGEIAAGVYIEPILKFVGG